MNVDRDKMIQDLCRMDKDLRLRSLLFEMHFEQYICPAIKERKAGALLTTGWILGENSGRHVAIKEVSHGYNECDKLLSAHLKKCGWDVRQLHFDDGIMKDKERRNDWFQESCNAAGRYVRNLENEPKHYVSQEIIEYYENINYENLYCAWRARSVINGLMKSGMVSNIRDLDAVLINKLGRLSVIEFKRKAPMRNFFPLPRNIDISGLPEESLSFLNELVQVKKLTAEHFGLDISSHVRSLCDLNRHNIEYWYLILESKNTSPKDFFCCDFQPTYTAPLLISRINLESFHGITFTEGKHEGGSAQSRDQSGSFNKNRRYQLTVPKTHFRKFSLVQ